MTRLVSCIEFVPIIEGAPFCAGCGYTENDHPIKDRLAGGGHVDLPPAFDDMEPDVIAALALATVDMSQDELDNYLDRLQDLRDAP